MIAKNDLCVYIQGMNTLKKFNNCAQLCASLIIGFTPNVFAADTDARLMSIPPPPTLQAPSDDSKPVAAVSAPNKRSITIGTSKVTMPNVSVSAAKMPKLTTSNAGLFAAKDAGDAVSKQNSNTNAANEAKRAATQKAALFAPVITTTTWTFQQMSTDNTMYSTPLRK